MHWIDWIIALSPLVIVTCIGLHAQRYVKGVVDFLAAGRVAGRYVIAVAIGVAAYGLISLVGLFESYYKVGFAVDFWGKLTIMIGTIVSLSGFCIFRYRETRVLTLGQFLEIRYSRKFRICAAILQTVSGVVNFAIFPAVGARFLIYFCRLPLHVEILGMSFPTFGLVMALFLSIALIIVSMGGQITVIVTDCVQGILGYPLYTIIAVFLFVKFSYFGEVGPALLDRPAGESMLNPYDISKLRDFNLFYVFAGVLCGLLNTLSWSGTAGYSASAITAHEQKMGGILSNWRGGFQNISYTLLAIAAYTFLTHVNFAEPAREMRTELAHKAMHDVAGEQRFAEVHTEVNDYLQTGVIGDALHARIDGVVKKEQAEAEQAGKKVDESTVADKKTRYDYEEVVDVVYTALKSEDADRAQSFTTIFGQMRVPMAIRGFMPIGITGIFCALAIFLLISTDTTAMHSWGSVIVQDLILPLRKKPLTSRQHLNLLRIVFAVIAVIAFIFSLYFTQVDYILMFFQITGAIWMAGAGPCIVLGLYWKRGTKWGAYTSIFLGSTFALSGMAAQKYWVSHIYPWLVETNMIGPVSRFLEAVSKPFNPYILWEVTPDKFPINSKEIYFIGVVTTLILYIVVSLLTGRKPFNMDRMLHRGKYRIEGEEFTRPPLTLKNCFSQLVGIDSNYTRGDKILAWSVFLYNFVWLFGAVLIVVIWNMISPWKVQWWSSWFFIHIIAMQCLMGVVSTVWFTIGGVWDLKRLFRRLRENEQNELDDGSVIGNVSASDIEMVERVDHIKIDDAHQGQDDKTDGDKNS